MNYSSTRGNSEQVTSAEAIIKGLASDEGLFVPDSLPPIDEDFIESLVPLNYEERAAKVLGLFLTDYSPAEIQDCVTKAYGQGKFDCQAKAPVTDLGDMQVLELWHGPTSAFKDMALQLLPQLMSTALKKTGEKSQVLILVATSGDTGKAALEGFKDVPQISIMVFYPEGGVSRIQQLQMVTQEGANVNVTAVKGNFDDAQSGVKEIFADSDFAQKLAGQNVKLSSANSINWGRLVPQIVYYFSAYADLRKAGKITKGEAINFTVPTGNFGNILAAFYAQQMGLPIHKLVCASNANNVLTDFLHSGRYDRNRQFFKTITPSMDILISSNLERLLYHLTNDKAKVAGWMQDLKTQGAYETDGQTRQLLQEKFWADWVDDQATQACIHKVYQQHKYILDTHTAVAWQVAENYQKATGDDHKMVVVSTASPYKFNGSVLNALEVSTEGLDEFALLAKLQELNTNPIPQGLGALKQKAARHQDVCAKTDMRQAVLSFIGQ